MNELSPKAALNLIKAAKKLGVTSMKFGTLEFELSLDNTPRTRPALKVSKKKVQAVDEQNRYQADFETAKQDLSVMHVEDPAGFENAIIERELTDDGLGGEILEETHALEA